MTDQSPASGASNRTVQVSLTPLPSGAQRAAITLDGTQVYDALMSFIEPELVSAVIPTLEKKYRGEDPVRRLARMARYTEAFRRYDKVYDDFIANFRQLTATYQKQAFKTAETNERAAESSDEENLLQQITAA